MSIYFLNKRQNVLEDTVSLERTFYRKESLKVQHETVHGVPVAVPTPNKLPIFVFTRNISFTSFISQAQNSWLRIIF